MYNIILRHETPLAVTQPSYVYPLNPTIYYRFIYQSCMCDFSYKCIEMNSENPYYLLQFYYFNMNYCINF